MINVPISPPTHYNHFVFSGGLHFWSFPVTPYWFPEIGRSGDKISEYRCFAVRSTYMRRITTMKHCRISVGSNHRKRPLVRCFTSIVVYETPYNPRPGTWVGERILNSSLTWFRNREGVLWETLSLSIWFYRCFDWSSLWSFYFVLLFSIYRTRRLNNFVHLALTFFLRRN